MAGKLFKASGLVGLMLFFFIGLLSSRCDKEAFPEIVEMRLVFPFTIKTTVKIHVGDTIELEANFPDTVFELNTNRYYKIVDMDFKEKIGILKLVNPSLTIAEQPGAMNLFTIINQQGTISEAESWGDIKFLYTNEHYVFKAKLIANASGIFAINFLWPMQLNDGFDEGLHLHKYIDIGSSSDGKKRVPVHKTTFVIINEGNTNFDLFKANCRAISLEVPIEGNIYYEQKGTFTFEVK